MKGQHQFLYPSNVFYVRKETDDLEHKDEVMQYLKLRLKEIGFNKLLKPNTSLILFILIIFLSFTVGGALLVLYYGIVSAYIFISDGLPLRLLIPFGILMFGLLVFWFFAKPLIIGGWLIIKNLIAHTSSARVYLYLKESGELAQGWVKSVENAGAQTIIRYSFVPKNDKTRQDYYVTMSKTQIEVGATIYIVYTDSIGIIL